MEYVTLNDGRQMPLEGFGVYQIEEEEKCAQVVYDAIKVGYRLLDTAAVYFNEAAVGKGVARAIADGLTTREELFITSKIWVQDMKDEASAYNAVKTSLKNLQLEYIDLMLLHNSMNDYFAAWRGLERAKEEGLTKSIGVSNFYPGILTNFCLTVKTKPAVNQLELHPFLVRSEMLKTMKEYNIVAEAWSPLAEGEHGIFTDPELSAIGKKYNKSAAQVALKWNVQRGVVIIPKTVHVERMKQNLDIWDFTLTAEEMAIITAKDLGTTDTDHSDPETIKEEMEYKIHD